MTDTAKLILRTALDYVTEREIPGNQGWEDKKFQALMERTDWKVGDAWCAYFVEAVLIAAGLNDHAAVISGSAVKTFNNCKASPLFKTYEIPSIGDIVIWQNYVAGEKSWTGHAGWVVGMGKGMLITVEGNTDADGGREGIEVALKVRDPAAIPINGLRVLGYVRLV